MTTINKDEPAWVPRVFTIVLDTQTGIICTGSTQAACSAVPILKGATQDINRLRLGKPFIDIIDSCNENYKAQAALVLQERNSIPDGWGDSKTVQQLYNRIAVENKSDEYGWIPTPGKNGSIFCWAFQGHDLKEIAPCIRCQRFYREWDLYLRAETDAEKKDLLQKGLESHSARGKKENPCCAETIAAAKLYALRNGKLALI